MKVSCCNVHVHPMPHSVPEAWRNLFFVLCNYSSVHKYTSLLPLSWWSFMCTVECSKQYYAQMKELMSGLAINCGTEVCSVEYPTLFTLTADFTWEAVFSHKKLKLRELSMKANLLSDLDNNIDNRPWYISKGWHRYSKEGGWSPPCLPLPIMLA